MKHESVVGRGVTCRRRAKTGTIACAVAVAAVLSTGCASAIIGGAVLAVGVGAAVLTYECEEGISVTVWDPSTSHGVCDATVTAREQNGKEASFSPCFAGYLGKGTWTITAQKEGYFPAQGIVVIPPEHKCSEPVYHSVELTLRPDHPTGPAYGAPASYGPPPGPPPSYGVPRAYGPEPRPAPAPSGSAAPAPQSPAPPPKAPATQTPPPAGTAPPTGAFPLVPEAPPTR